MIAVQQRNDIEFLLQSKNFIHYITKSRRAFRKAAVWVNPAVRTAAACRALCTLFALRLLAALAPTVRTAAACRTQCAVVAPWLLATPAPAVRTVAVCRAQCALGAPWILATLAPVVRTAGAYCARRALAAPRDLTRIMVHSHAAMAGAVPSVPKRPPR